MFKLPKRKAPQNNEDIFLICFQIPVGIFLFMLNKFRGTPVFILFFLFAESFIAKTWDLWHCLNKSCSYFLWERFSISFHSLVRLIFSSYDQHKYIRNLKRQHSKYVLSPPLTFLNTVYFMYILFAFVFGTSSVRLGLI